MAVEKIIRYDDFWEKNMIGILTELYMDHILPEIINPRQTRNMPLRQPIIYKHCQSKEPSDVSIRWFNEFLDRKSILQLVLQLEFDLIDLYMQYLWLYLVIFEYEFRRGY